MRKINFKIHNYILFNVYVNDQIVIFYNFPIVFL